ncbi:MAG TPA: lactate dehydrogenase [Candidatus Blautia faecipullorum]|nr:lactate dehydrogenase [Candidatus Blautia faecipullorum]
MKLTAYEVRKDEEENLRKYAQRCGVDELVITGEPLTGETLELAEGAAGVTTLGQSVINEDICRQLHQMGVTGYSTRSVGYNHVDLEAAKKYGIRVSNASYSPHGVAEYTVMMILMSLRKYKPALYRINVNDYSLDGLVGGELCEMTVGIIGTGKIGETVIRNLAGFGCRIYAYDIYEKEEVKKYAVYRDLDTIYKECDIISLHTPLMDSTYHMIDRDAVKKMKKGVILVNCARGELMDIEAVTRGVEDEKIGAVALDVFENENGIYHHDRRTEIIKNRDMAYLRQFPNVIMTQHMAFYTRQAVDSMVKCGVESLAAFARQQDYFCRLA